MSLFTAFAVYFIIWWITLFLVLPHGVKSQAELGKIEPGTDPGAPARSDIGRKLLINTLVASIVFGLWWFATYRLGWSLDNLPSIFPQDRQG